MRTPATLSRLNPELLRSFAQRFYGYGNPNARLWIVSMEEGGGATKGEIAARLIAWRDLGCPETCDVAEFHKRAHIAPELFRERPRLQRTWYRMIRIILSAAGTDPNPELARGYQRDRLGRRSGETRLLPLLPLPSPSLKVWRYPKWCKIPELRDRSTYRDSTLERRIEYISSQIRSGRPQSMIFLGSTYREYAERIICRRLEQHRDGFWWTLKGSMRVVACHHPNTRGMRNSYFDRVGRWLHTH
jgi:hypothetical protein